MRPTEEAAGYRRSTRWLATMAVLALVATACQASSTPSATATPVAATPTAVVTEAPTATPEPATIKVGAFREISEAFMWSMGDYAKKYNITLEFLELGSYPEQVQGVIKGDADIVISGTPQVVTLAANNIANVKEVVGISLGAQYLVVKTDVPATKWTDLEGKKVCAPYSTGVGILLKIAMIEGGADLNKVDQVQTGFTGTAELQALQAGQCDALAFWSPAIDESVIGGYGKLEPGLDINATSLGPQNGVMVAGPKLLSNRPLLVNFLKAYVESMQAVRSDTEKWVSLAAQLTGASEAVIREALKHQVLDYRIDVSAVRAATKYGPQFGFATTDPGDAVTNVIDASYLADATGQSVADLTVKLTLP